MLRQRNLKLILLLSSLVFVLSPSQTCAVDTLYLGSYSVPGIFHPRQGLTTVLDNLPLEPSSVALLPALPILKVSPQGHPTAQGIQFILLSPTRIDVFQHPVQHLDIWIDVDGETIQRLRLPIGNFSLPKFVNSQGLFDPTRVAFSQSVQQTFAIWGKKFTRRISDAWEVEIRAGIPNMYDETRFILAYGLRAKRLLGLKLTDLYPLECAIALMGVRCRTQPSTTVDSCYQY